MTETRESTELEAAFERVLEVALIEDLGEGDIEADVTTITTVPENLWGTEQLVAKQDGVHVDCPPELEGVRVLLVDDEADTRELVKELLESCKVQVRIARSAAEGLAALAEELPDIVISDLGMPGMSEASAT